jgi:hypothetical protein
MCGLFEWIKRTQDAVANANVYVDNSLVEIDKATLDNLIKSMWLAMVVMLLIQHLLS